MFFILKEPKVREKMENNYLTFVRAFDSFLKSTPFYFPLLEHTAMQHCLCKGELYVS